MTSLREYLYIDDIEINSTLAQINEGLNQKTTRVEKHNELKSVEHNQSGKLSGKGSIQVPFVAKGEVSVDAEAGRTSGTQKSDGAEDMVESVYNDFGVEVLENQLLEDGLLKSEGDEIHFGDFIRFKQAFDIVDFSVIETVSNPELLLETMSQGVTQSDIDRLETEISKQQKKSQKNWTDEQKQLFSEQKEQLAEMKDNLKEGQSIANDSKAMHEFGKLGNAIFKDSVLIRGAYWNSYAERNHFRFNKVQLSMLQNNPRKGTIIGIVENKVHIEENPFDESKGFSGLDLARLDTYWLNSIFSNFKIAFDGDLMIKPLAIYFD